MLQTGRLAGGRLATGQPGAGSEQAAPGSSQLRLDFVDSLRAIAAMAVVVVHAFQMFGLGLPDIEQVNPQGGLGSNAIDQTILWLYTKVVWLFPYAVEIFIAISGYSLMLAIARSRDGRIRGGLPRYFQRRAKRILPPYFAAVLLALLVIVAVPGMNRPMNVYWDAALPALEWDVILSHLFLVHNWFPEMVYRLNPPLWSIAVEWQLYFVFPILVLVWRTWGSAAMVGLSLLLGVVPVYLPFYPGSHLHSWYIVLFAMGMLGGLIGFSTRPGETWLRERLPWGLLTLIAGGAFLAFGAFEERLAFISHNYVLKDTLVSIIVACFLVYATRHAMRTDARQPIWMRLVTLSPLVKLGVFSYSIYLIHLPILALITLGCLYLQTPVTVSYLIVIGVGIPLVVLVSYLFYLVCEKPFLNQHQPARWPFAIRLGQVPPG